MEELQLASTQKKMLMEETCLHVCHTIEMSRFQSATIQSEH
jgi:hypothetical protein